MFDRASLNDTRMRVDAQAAIYATGDEDDSLYLIESGQVKLLMSSAEGKDCLLAIYTAGEVFGESCFTGEGKRFESAIAMQPTVVRRASRRDFMAEVERSAAFETLLRHIAMRLAERQTAVFDAVTMESERRLGKVLLAFAGVEPAAPLAPVTQHTIVDPARLRRELRAIRRRGFATNEQESRRGLYGVAVPLRAGDELLGGVALSVWSRAALRPALVALRRTAPSGPVL
ncbi:MAG TPA: cyclic nucleotide-binding domain-containing protein [Thermoanaerobaculia bacterium]|nr:cyclic nucleotide-binding domain-containing protein [Thermoanaerobaculia bacterium]